MKNRIPYRDFLVERTEFAHNICRKYKQYNDYFKHTRQSHRQFSVNKQRQSQQTERQRTGHDIFPFTV